jgi:serine phosphatase RsbU (regulator of sigma subunit)
MDVDRTMRTVVENVVPKLADWATVTVVQPDGRLRVVAAAHRDPAREPLLRELVERHPLTADAAYGAPLVIRTGQAEVISDVSPELLQAAITEDAHLRRLRELGMRHSAVLPLRTPTGVIGALSLLRGDAGRAFTTDDLNLLTSLASRAALHVQNARLYTERSHIASALQEGLQPSTLPDVPGLQLAVRYHPAGVENAVGGDFYDVFERPGGGWSGVLGDVSGKGPDAAALTALARHTFFAGALQGGDAEENLRLVNAALLRRAGPEGFCTAVAIDVHPHVGGATTVHLANGGHPAPLLLRADGTVEETVASGTLIGAVEEIVLEVQEIVLAPGDALVVFTDGAIELRGEDPGDGARVLREALAQAAGRDAGALAETVQRRIVAAAGGELRDDLALLVLRALP